MQNDLVEKKIEKRLVGSSMKSTKHYVYIAENTFYAIPFIYIYISYLKKKGLN